MFLTVLISIQMPYRVVNQNSDIWYKHWDITSYYGLIKSETESQAVILNSVLFQL